MKTFKVIFSDESMIALRASNSREATLVATGIANEGTRYVVEVKEIASNAVVTCDYVTNAEVA